MGSVANVSTARGSPMSPESEDSSTGGSLGSEASYGFDALVLPKDQEGFTVEVPPSPEVQDELGMEADMSKEEEGSMSPKSQTSYGMMTYPLPEEGEEGAELPPVVVAQNRDVSVPQM